MALFHVGINFHFKKSIPTHILYSQQYFYNYSILIKICDLQKWLLQFLRTGEKPSGVRKTIDGPAGRLDALDVS